jgi:hypothetical protein
MSASVRSLALYDLLAPQFLLGFSFPDYIDKYLSVLSVSDLQTSSDDNAVLYTGTVYFPSGFGSNAGPPQHTDPSGAVFDFDDLNFRFRLLIPRSGAAFIQTAVDAIPLAFPPSLQPLKDDVFGTIGSPAAPTDFPGVAFELELLLDLLTFHLGSNWQPAVQNADFSISPNPGSPPHTDVRVLLPQILLRYTQVEDFAQPPDFEVAAWGNPGFDAPNDLAEGQLATMDPPLAIDASGHWAFGVDTIVLDLSSNGAPPEILAFFGTDDSFKGLYIKAIQVYYSDPDKDLALNFAVRDALISFAGEIWMDIEVDLIFDAFTVAVTAWDGSNKLAVNTGSQLSPTLWHSGEITLPSTGVVYLQIAGGIPPYTESVTFNPGAASPPPTGGQQLWDNTQRLAQAPAVTSGAQETGALTITVTDSSLPTPQKYVNTLKCTVPESTGSTGTAPAPPAPPSNAKPHALRRLSIQLRLEKNVPVLVDISGEYDFAAQAQSAVPGGSPATGSNSLGVTNTPQATSSASSPPSGIVDFDLNVTYDLATGNLSETLTLGAAPADVNGLVNMVNPDDSALKDILGAVMIFTPILSAATSALDPADAGQWSEIAIDLGVPVAIGALDIIRTTGITLYGGSLQLRENIPAGRVTNAALTFDYGVQFGIEIDALSIKSTKPLKVRYQAVGVSLHFGHPVQFQIVLDTSKGYSLDLSDPGLFNLPGALGDLLKIAGARIARFNPLTLEVDIVIKADLGIITVDKFTVKVPLDGSGTPSITPSGIKVNIPETITGSGIVNISDGGFEGQLDVTLCSIGLRMVASVGVEHVTQGAREATAFYFGFEVDFPAPVTLGTTGLALFGIFGLFGMHYDRLLSAPIPGDAVGPDLRWLMSTKGQPYLIESQDGTVQYWTPEIDNWAFGIGVVLGSDDGYLINMRGMFVLELPGPRIIITTNLKFIADLPDISSDGMDATELDVGIIGILDLDFSAGQITLGAMIDLEITDLLSLQIPVQLYYSWVDPSSWHFWLGTIQTPASAKILGIVRGGGYFMIGGQAIQPFPPGSNSSLPGVAVAMGISASIVWGSQSAGIYLKVSASADFGVSFAPTLFIVGDVHLEGSLHLLVVNIGATGDFELTAPNPVYLHVHVCGSVSFFFFSVSACVDFSIGNQTLPPNPPPLISNFYLQSFAPVIAQGQGDKPIDASLGNAVAVGASGNAPLPIVPINTVPVIQMLYGVDVSTVTSTFTQPLSACPTFPGAPGANLGGGSFAQYQITSLSISPPLPTGSVPPTAWRPNKPSSDTSQTQVDLALFSRNPNVTNSALERSDQLSGVINGIFGQTCTPVAPAACVLWAFCGQRLGPSPNGWLLSGIPYPDPPYSVRRSPVPTTMQVVQPTFSAADSLLLTLGLPLAQEGILPAQVIGGGGDYAFIAVPPCLRAVELPQLVGLGLQSSLAEGFSGSDGRITATGAAAAIQQAQQLAAGSCWLRFETGASQQICMLLALNGALYKQMQAPADQGWVSIAELDSSGAVVVSHSLPSLHPVLVTTANAVAVLPSTWTAATGPWARDVGSILELFVLETGLVALYLEFVPTAAMASIEVRVAVPSTFKASVLVGAIESCPTSETTRVQTETQIQESVVQAITTYLDGAGAPVPLLAPDTLYTVTVAYDVLNTVPGSSSPIPTSNTQAFQFRTDQNPPATLDAYVLCTSPAQGEQYFFYEDPVCILFNDASIFPVFEAYGYQLTADLHAADGLPEGSPSGALLTGSPSPLQAINGIGTAMYDAMQALAKTLPCIDVSVSQYQNQLYTAPVYLRPLMGYTFDLITDPGAPAASPSSPPSAVTPLFRRNFSTGRYASMLALADAFLTQAKITHRTLTAPLVWPAGGGTQTVKDADIQQAFLDAGEQALGAPTANSIVMYWLASGGSAAPHAILLDAIEPLWRSRSEPGFTMPIASDPSFQIVTIQAVTALEIVEGAASPASAAIGSFIVSPGATRVVAMFKTGLTFPPDGTMVTLDLHRPASVYYNLGDESVPMLQLLVTPQPPWENDHV